MVCIFCTIYILRITRRFTLYRKTFRPNQVLIICRYFKKEILCKTLGGNCCYKITITAPKISHKEKKKTIILSSRVHPGETVSSWMIRGSLFFLTGPSPLAEALRQRYVFVIIPMLNPDGVIQGNYRTSLLGSDLNRKYNTASKILHPTVYYYRMLCREIADANKCEFLCDYHGHSRK